MFSATLTDYVVNLDEEKVSALARIWSQQDPSKLLESLFSWAYQHYVEDEDELVSGKLMRKRTDELEAQVEDLKRKLGAKSVPQNDRRTLLCPKCFNRVGPNEIGSAYLCPKCGWEGPSDKAVRRDAEPS